MSEHDIFINFPKNLDKPIEKIIDDITEEINPKITGRSTKLQRFVEEYNKEFGDDDHFDNSDFIQTEVLHIIKAPLMFYALNMNGQV